MECRECFISVYFSMIFLKLFPPSLEIFPSAKGRGVIEEYTVGLQLMVMSRNCCQGVIDRAKYGNHIISLQAGIIDKSHRQRKHERVKSRGHTLFTSRVIIHEWMLCSGVTKNVVSFSSKFIMGPLFEPKCSLLKQKITIFETKIVI